MDKNKNLEQFFRNRVNDLDSTDDDWDRPDASVFRNAQAQFPTYPRKRIWDWKIISIAILAAFALGLLSIVFYLNNKTTTLEEQLEIAQTEVKNVDKKLNDLQNEYTKKITDSDNQKSALDLPEGQHKNLTKVKSNVQNNTDLNEIAKSFTVQFAEAKKAVDNSNIGKPNISKNKATTVVDNSLPLVNESSQFKSTTNMVLSIENNSQATDKVKTIQDERLQGVSVKSNTNSSINPTVTKYNKTLTTSLPSLTLATFKNSAPTIRPKYRHTIEKLVSPRLPKANRFEIGLYASSLNFKIPTDYSFKDQKEEDKKSVVTNKGVFTSSLKVAYRIRKNIWINTGFRKADINTSQYYSAKLYYDKSKEYTDSSGEKFNTLSLGEGIERDVDNEITFEIPESTDIDDKELYFTKWNHSKDFSWIQVPIGLSYFQGKKKLQLLAAGGIGWNIISGSESFDDIRFSYKEDELPITDKGFLKKDELKADFMSAYAELGLNYQITNNWQIRSSFTLERNFTQNNKAFNIGDLNQLLQAGIAYRW